MRIRVCCTVLVAIIAVSRPTSAVAQVDQARAQEFFREAREVCERDGGRLWGVPVCGPMVIGDARTRTFATSEPAPDEPRPNVIGILNGPIQWGGKLWAAMTWDTLANWPARTRGEAFVHEVFHILQQRNLVNARFDKPSKDVATTNEHLDSADGRYWLRLEWRALAAALRASGTSRTLAVGDALAFQRTRLSLFPTQVESERALNISEGLASYTQTVLAAPSHEEAVARGLELLAEADGAESFVRTFSYTSGPAYGLLLDAASPGWTRRVQVNEDPTTLLMRALAVEPAADATASAVRYGGTELRAAEDQRAAARQARLDELRRRFVEGPVFVMPGGGGGVSNSLGATVIPAVGTVYFHAYRMSGEWGALDANDGVLVTTDGRLRHLAAPSPGSSTTISGPGWTFKAAPGWTVREGARRGDYELIRQP